ncbi:MAG: ferredoxin [Clostridia bacterium]|nr:ferredoxin [Clostridia bacterium]
MSHKVQIIDENNELVKTLDAKDGELLHSLLVHEHGYHAPCGGNRTCKKCKVRIKNEIPYMPEEKNNLNDEEIKEGIHFACLLQVTEDLTVQLKANRYQIAEDIYEQIGAADPIIKRTHLSLRELKCDIKADYISMLKKQIGADSVSLEVVKRLPQLIINEINEIVVIHDEKKIIGISEKVEAGYGIAIDIGTTTIVSYLYNLSTGTYKDVISDINHQKNFGFDVIARIKHAHEASGLEELRKSITSQLNEMIESLLKKNSLHQEQLDELVIVGNTIMMHLFVGANPKDIGIAPFTPVFTESIYTEALKLGLKVSEHCMVLLLPSIAAYVGADIVSGMIAAKMHEEDTCSLLVDIGTNGEIALLNHNQITCCATAAGPAFEGANITYGVGGVFGAINKIFHKNGKLCYTTINNEAPIGICGSGLIDGIAYMLDQGYIDETGYLEGDDLAEIDEMTALEIAKKQDHTSIYITQKDVREIQLAKGSIRAGIDTMIDESGIKVEEISKIYIAGGFGSFMDKESAIKIGLLPKELEHKIVSIGNAAGIGAIKVLLNKECLKQVAQVKEKCKYVELSNSVKFMDYYMESMSF